ncbi:MAG: hypothetical protein WDW38_007150 [Sanguina aurantia]
MVSSSSVRFLPLLLIIAASTKGLAQYQYDYGYTDTYDDFYDTEEETSYDEYGYYENEDEAYYEYYGYYADDSAGYEDYYSDEYEFHEECSIGAGGKPVLANTTASCDIKIMGVNKQADKLSGGLDGIYTLSACYNGKPLYKREQSPVGEDRVLWYSSTFGDWDISKGVEPNEAEILMYGGEMEHANVPLFVSSWHLGGDLKSDTTLGEDDYLPISVKVLCADGTVYQPSEMAASSIQQQRSGPILTDDEMEAKYQYIFDRYGNADPSPTINFTFVVLLVMTGLTIVLAIPYFLLKKKGGKPSISMSFAQMLNQSKKKQSGHVN